MSRVAVIYRTWLCLASLSNNNSGHIHSLDCDKSSTLLSSQTTKSIVQVVANSCLIPFSELASPCIKGKDLPIKIIESKYQVCFAGCQNILHGCLCAIRSFHYPKKSLRLLHLLIAAVKTAHVCLLPPAQSK
jgi:hypothetical protein